MILDVWTDGSGTYQEGPACIGVAVFEGGVLLCEASEYIGLGTNNLAELRAIRRGLYLATEIGGYGTDVVMHVDSRWAIGAITNPTWELHHHRGLAEAIRLQIEALGKVAFEHVHGHAGIYGNELADWLAGRARTVVVAASGKPRKMKRRPEPPPDHPAAAVSHADRSVDPSRAPPRA